MYPIIEEYMWLLRHSEHLHQSVLITNNSLRVVFMSFFKATLIILFLTYNNSKRQPSHLLYFVLDANLLSV